MGTNETDVCCPRFEPEPWDEKEVTWDDKLFVKDRVRSLFHIPLNFGAVMKRNVDAIDAAGVQTPSMMVLSDENSLWGADVYLEVNGEVPGAVMTTLSGTFLTKVFEGPYGDTRKWIDAMKAFVAGGGRNIRRMYFWYTTCPKCAKKYGKNYVALFAQV